MALETFNGTAGAVGAPDWVQQNTGATLNRNGSGKAQPSALGQNCLAVYLPAVLNEPNILTYGNVGGGDDYMGVACFVQQGPGSTTDWYSVELALGTNQININLFTNNNYISTRTSWNTPGNANQAVGDQLEVICSIVSGDPHFEVYYTPISTGVRSLVGSYTDTVTATPPVGSGFGIYAYAGTGVAVTQAEGFEGGSSATTINLGVPFLSHAGQDFAPSLFEGPEDSILAVPFDGEDGEDFTPGIDPGALSVEVPFLNHVGSDFAPTVQVIEYQIEIMPAGSGTWELLHDWEPSLIFPSNPGYPAGATGIRARARDSGDPVASVSGWTEISVNLVEAEDVGVPFLAHVGLDFAPAIDVAEGTIAVPFLAPAGQDFAPSLEIPVPVLVPFLAHTGLDFSPDITIGIEGVTLSVPFASGSGQEFVPVILLEQAVILVPFLTESGEDFAPEVGIGIEGETLVVPFLPHTGQSFAPSLEEGIDEVAIAIPFNPESGMVWTPGIDLGLAPVAVLVPFLESSGNDWAPVVWPLGHGEYLTFAFIALVPALSGVISTRSLSV